MRNDVQTSGDSANGTRWEYTYDLGGNILTKTPFKMNTDGDWVVISEKAVTYEYENADWADQMTAYDGQLIEYDAIGNPLHAGDTSFEWQGGRKLMKLTRSGTDYHTHGRLRVDGDSITQITDGPQSFEIVGGDLTSSQGIYALNDGDVTTPSAGDELTVEFRYDASGLRTQKKVTQNGVTATTDYYLHGKLLMHLKKTADGAAEPEELHFYYDAQSRPIMLKYGVGEKSEYFTYVHNLQGDVLGILDRNQNLVVEYQYDPWGKPLNTIPKQTPDPALNTLYANLATLNPFRYRGYLFDDEIGLYYLRSRYYNPEWGRFVNQDILIGVAGKLLSHNLFVYCGNNPVIRTDKNGRNWADDLIQKHIQDKTPLTEEETKALEGYFTAFYIGIQTDNTTFCTEYSQAVWSMAEGIGRTSGDGLSVPKTRVSTPMEQMEEFIADPNLLSGKSLSTVQDIAEQAGIATGTLTKGSHAGQGWKALWGEIA